MQKIKYLIGLICILSFAAAAQALKADDKPTKAKKPVYLINCNFADPTNAQPCIVQDLTFRNYRKPTMYPAYGKPEGKGLENLFMSGSAQPDTVTAWQMIKSNAEGARKIYDVDLRQESHGYLNTLPITLVGSNNDMNAELGANGWAVMKVENRWLRKLEKYSAIHSVQVKDTQQTANPEIIPIHQLATEEAIVTRNGFEYRRIPLADKTGILSKSDLRQIVNVIRRADQEHAWIHFHCREGEQRTATAMTIDDILHNAKQVSFEDILDREANGVSPPIDFNKYPELVNVLQNFYTDVAAGKYEEK